MRYSDLKRKKLVIGSILMGMTLSLSACGSSVWYTNSDKDAYK
ncbi:hypothetical protein [Bacillus cereus]|nr:hypothetical protein [Bacillus cereus]